MNLDMKDRRILYELDKNARASFSEIAKKVNLSKNSVINRIKKLEDEKLILSYNGVININHLGYTTYDIYLKFQDTTPKREREIIDLAIKNKNIWLVGKLEGFVSLVLFISTKTPEEFYDIWDYFYRKIRKNVKVMRIAILLEYHHFTKEYLITDDVANRTIEKIGKKNYVKVDDIDLRILKIISKNARIPLIDLSEKFKLTPKTMKNRVKRLEREKVILGYNINFDFQKLGYEYYKVLLTLNNLEIREDLYKWIVRNPNIVYYDKFLNGADFEFDVEISSFEKFVNLLENIKKDFKKSIKEIEWFSAIKIYKSSYF